MIRDRRILPPQLHPHPQPRRHSQPRGDRRPRTVSPGAASCEAGSAPRAEACC